MNAMAVAPRTMWLVLVLILAVVPLAGSGATEAGMAPLIRLTEVMANPDGRDDAPWPGGEWVELANLGNTSVDLSGWMLRDAANNTLVLALEHLVDGDPERPTGTTIPAGAIWLVARNGSSFAMNNGAETLELVTDSGDVADSVSWSSTQANRTLAWSDVEAAWLADAEPTPAAANPRPPPPSAVRLTGIMPAAPVGRDDEAVAVTNIGHAIVELDRLSLRVGRGQVRLQGSLAAHATLWVSQHPANFLADSGWEAIASPDGWRTLSNSGGHVQLVDDWGRVLDTVAWGGEDTTGLEGWLDWPVELPPSVHGAVLLRGDGCSEWPDSDMEVDWSVRLHQLGMNLGCGGGAFTTSSATVRVIVHPDGAAEQLVAWLDGATESLHIHLYQLTHGHAIDALLRALERGVEVTLVMEAEPLTSSGEHALGRAALADLADAGASVIWLGTPSGDDAIPAPYRFIHSKAGVRDGQSVWIGTENWKPSGFPTDGAAGNRGISLIVEEPQLAQLLLERFAWDENLSHPHVWAHDAGLASDGRPTGVSRPTAVGTPAAWTGTPITGAVSGQLLTCADDCVAVIVGAIDEAATSIDLWLASLDIDWEVGQHSPLIQALEAAAARGVRIRLLLDAAFLAFDGQDIWAAADLLHAWRAEHAANVTVRLFHERPGVTKLHAKAAIFDGEEVLVGSMNWNPSSMLHNREHGLLLHQPEVASELARWFEVDWATSLFTVADSDHDGVEDGLEVQHGFDPTSADDEHDADDDGDGLSNWEEALLGTDRDDPDTDGDCILDGDEEAAGTDPDADGLINAFDADADGDGIPDGGETDCGRLPMTWTSADREPASSDGLPAPGAVVATLALLTAAAVTTRRRRADPGPRPSPPPGTPPARTPWPSRARGRSRPRAGSPRPTRSHPRARCHHSGRAGTPPWRPAR